MFLFQFVMLSKNNDYYEFKDIFKMLSKCAGNTSKDVEKWKRILVLRTKIQKTKIYYFFVFLSEAWWYQMCGSSARNHYMCRFMDHVCSVHRIDRLSSQFWVLFSSLTLSPFGQDHCSLTSSSWKALWVIWALYHPMNSPVPTHKIFRSLPVERCENDCVSFRWCLYRES